MFLYLLLSLRATLNIVYLLPLLFSTFAKLGQLYPSTVFLRVSAALGCAIISICISKVGWYSIPVDKIGLPLKVLMGVSLKTLYSMDIMAQ